MKLYFNGCSFVYGGELDNPERDSFPNVLQRKIDCEILDDSENGISNQRILRTTLSRDLKDYMAIIGFTSLYRTEYISKNGTWAKLNPSLKIRKEHEDFSMIKDEWLMMNFINQVLVLQNHFKYNNIPFFFFLSFANNMDEREKVLKYWTEYKENKPMSEWIMGYEDLFSCIDEETFPSLFDSGLVFQDYCLSAGNDTLPNFHPTKESHQLWADYLMDKIR